MILFNGTLVDIGKLMEQLTRSESARIDTEKSLGKLRDELCMFSSFCYPNNEYC